MYLDLKTVRTSEQFITLLTGKFATYTGHLVLLRINDLISTWKGYKKYVQSLMGKPVGKWRLL
jgi:hypothetical protein